MKNMADSEAIRNSHTNNNKAIVLAMPQAGKGNRMPITGAGEATWEKKQNQEQDDPSLDSLYSTVQWNINT